MGCLPTWMYRDPGEIGDRLIERSDRATRKAQREDRRILRMKQRRIQALTRAALKGERR